MPSNKTILFLYTRLPDYFYQCVRHFVTVHHCKAVIVRYRGDANTKYSFSSEANIELLYKEEVDIPAFIAQLRPAAIVLSGWSDKAYTAIAKKYVKQIPVVLALDNPWTCSMRQKLLVAAAPWFIHNFSNCAWVPGWSQFEYARRLGFEKNKIYKELYCADTGKFYDYRKSSDSSTKDRPKIMVFVGRMVEYKQPHVLARVFNEVAGTGDYKWTLVLAGEGPLKEPIAQQNYKHVKQMNFLDPAALPDFYSGAGAFCLPSRDEHWGVAVQEAAAAGLPLLLSDTVDAGSTFLINGHNGFSFQTGNELSLAKSLRLLMGMDEQRLTEMGRHSIELSKRINHLTWSATLNNIINRQ